MAIGGHAQTSALSVGGFPGRTRNPSNHSSGRVRAVRTAVPLRHETPRQVFACVLSPSYAVLSSDAMKAGLSSGLRIDRYELLTEVARGGMGAVWLARGVRAHGFEKLFALKFAAVSVDDEDGRAMFFDEVRIASRVDHPNVAQVYDVGEHEGQLYAVIEWIDGFSLRELVVAAGARNERIDARVALQIMADVCAGLHAVHELRDRDGTLLDVVHRDVSPHNILVSHHGHAKIIDFGIARSRSRLAALTGQDSLKGKLRFMAPEQAFGEAVDRRADLWSLGAVLFDTLTGAPPCTGASNEEVVRALARYRRPPDMPPMLPRAMAVALSKALQRRPQDRYATAAQFQAALLEALRTRGGASPTDVAAYVHASMADTLEIRRERITLALRRADGDAKPSSGGSRMDDEPSNPSSSAPLELVVAAPLAPSGARDVRPQRTGSRVVLAFALVGFVVLLVVPWLRMRGSWAMRQAAADQTRALSEAPQMRDPCAVPLDAGLGAR